MSLLRIEADGVQFRNKRKALFLGHRMERCELSRSKAQALLTGWGAGMLYSDPVSGAGAEFSPIGERCVALAADRRAGAASLHAARHRHLELQCSASACSRRAEVRARPLHTRNSGLKSRVQGLCTRHSVS